MTKEYKIEERILNSTIVGIVSPRPNNTSSTWATCLAWSFSANYSVVLVDLDMAGGSISDILQLNTNGKNIGRLSINGVNKITISDLEKQLVTVPNRSNLRVLPGLMQEFGPKTSLALLQLVESLRAVNADLIIVDLGSPFSYPGLRVEDRSRPEEQEGNLIWSSLDQIFVVIKDDPLLIDVNCQILERTNLPSGKLVVCQNSHRKESKDLINKLQSSPKTTKLTTNINYWNWDTKKNEKMYLSGTPLVFNNLDSLQIL